MGYTQWILVQEPDRTFRFVTLRRYARFHAGLATLPQIESGEVRTVEVTLEFHRRAVSEVLRLDHRRVPVLLDSGQRDPGFMEWEISLVPELLGLSSGTRADSARRRFAQRQLAGVRVWIPTAEEASAIANAVSRRSKRPLLGGEAAPAVR